MANNHSKISPAGIEDLSDLMELYQACTLKMNQDGLYNWNESYPGLATITDDIETGSMFVYREGRIIGAMAINQHQPAEYKEIAWADPSPEFMVVKRLAIDPEFQRKGIAKAMMVFAEEYASSNHFTSIRLDVYSISQAARLLYRKLNYKELGEFHFPDIELAFIAMEKLIEP